MMRSLTCAAVLSLLVVPVLAADVEIGDETEAPGATASIPVTFANTSDAVTLASVTVTANVALGTPTVVPTEQTNLDTGSTPPSLFVDELSPGVYRITALALSAPNLAVAGGNAYNIEFDLTGVPENTYPITISEAELYDTSSADVTGTLLDGQLVVAQPTGVREWSMIEY